MRTHGAVPAILVLALFAAAPALATNYAYVGGPDPGVTNDGTWKWMQDMLDSHEIATAGIGPVYNWIQSQGAGTDWEIRVYGGYSESVGAGSIDLGAGLVGADTASVIRGAMTWQTGAGAPVNVAQNLADKSTVSGTSAPVFYLHAVARRVSGFEIEGSVLIWPGAAGSEISNSHLSGSGSGVGIDIADNNAGVYVLNSLVEGFDTGLRYWDNNPGRSVFIVQSTIADNTTGITNGGNPFVGNLQLSNSIVAAANEPVAQVSAWRYYKYSDVYDGDGSLGYVGFDVNVAGSILANPLLAGDYTLGSASLCKDAGGSVDGGTFYYVDVDPSIGFQPNADVVVAGTPPANAKYVILSDLAGNLRYQGLGVDMGAFELGAGPAAVPEPRAALGLVLGLALVRLRRASRRSL